MDVGGITFWTHYHLRVLNEYLKQHFWRLFIITYPVYLLIYSRIPDPYDVWFSLFCVTVFLIWALSQRRKLA